jgi:hypothetical protein
VRRSDSLALVGIIAAFGVALGGLVAGAGYRGRHSWAGRTKV